MIGTRIANCLGIMLLLSPLSFAADRWPEWRGPTGQGLSAATGLPVKWSETENVTWKTEIPGRGWSTPIVEDGRVWLTTAIDQPASQADAQRRRKTSTNSQPLIISERVSFRVVSVDLETGELLLDHEVLTEKDPQMIHVENSYATPTPVIEDGVLYCHFGPSGILALDIQSNEVLWCNRSLRVKHENGPASSPVLWKNLLIVHCDGIDEQYVVALETQTGRQAWKVRRSGAMDDDPQQRKSCATPLLVDIAGAQQLISPAADWLYAYDPASGEELWSLPYGRLGFSNAARPVAGRGLIYSCTGYMKSELLAVRVDPREETGKVVWRYGRQVPNISSPLLVGSEIYFGSDNGIASCIDAKTGAMHWNQRIGKSFWASPLYADGRVYFFDRTGTTTVVTADRQFERLGVNSLDGEMLAGAAAVDGALILRTDKAVYRVD